MLIFRPCLSACHLVCGTFSKYFQAIYDNRTYNKIRPKVLWQFYKSYQTLVTTQEAEGEHIVLKIAFCLHSWQMTPTGSESTPSWYGLLDNCP